MDTTSEEFVSTGREPISRNTQPHQSAFAKTSSAAGHHGKSQEKLLAPSSALGITPIPGKKPSVASIRSIINEADMKSFKQEMDARIQSFNSPDIPDFGLPNQVNLFEDLKQINSDFYTDENGEQRPKERQSLWMVFYEAIHRMPKFQKLKNFIEKSNEERDKIEQRQKREALEKYFIQKQLENQQHRGLLGTKPVAKKQATFRKRPTANRSLDKSREQSEVESGEMHTMSLPHSPKDQLMKEVDEIMKDKEQFKKMQKLLSQEQKEKTQNELRLLKSKKIMSDLSRWHLEGQRRYEELKRVMRYKYPGQATRERLMPFLKSDCPPQFVSNYKKRNSPTEMAKTAYLEKMFEIMQIQYNSQAKIDHRWAQDPISSTEKQNFVQLNISKAFSSDRKMNMPPGQERNFPEQQPLPQPTYTSGMTPQFIATKSSKLKQISNDNSPSLSRTNNQFTSRFSIAGKTDIDIDLMRRQSGVRLGETDYDGNTGTLFRSQDFEYDERKPSPKSKIKVTRNHILKLSFLNRSSQRASLERSWDAKENISNFKNGETVIEKQRVNAQEIYDSICSSLIHLLRQYSHALRKDLSIAASVKKMNSPSIQSPPGEAEGLERQPKKSTVIFSKQFEFEVNNMSPPDPKTLSFAQSPHSMSKKNNQSDEEGQKGTITYQMRPSRRFLVLQEKRFNLIKLIIEKIETQQLEKLDLDAIPIFFKTPTDSLDVVGRILPVLRLLIRFTSQKTQKDQSYKNVLFSKLMEASRQLKNISVTGSTVSSMAPFRQVSPMRAGSIDLQSKPFDNQSLPEQKRTEESIIAQKPTAVMTSQAPSKARNTKSIHNFKSTPLKNYKIQGFQSNMSSAYQSLSQFSEHQNNDRKLSNSQEKKSLFEAVPLSGQMLNPLNDERAKLKTQQMPHRQRNLLQRRKQIGGLPDIQISCQKRNQKSFSNIPVKPTHPTTAAFKEWGMADPERPIVDKTQIYSNQSKSSFGIAHPIVNGKREQSKQENYADSYLLSEADPRIPKQSVSQINIRNDKSILSTNPMSGFSGEITATEGHPVVEYTQSFDPTSPTQIMSAKAHKKKGKKPKTFNQIFRKMKKKGKYEQIIISPERSGSPGRLVLNEQSQFEIESEIPQQRYAMKQAQKQARILKSKVNSKSQASKSLYQTQPLMSQMWPTPETVATPEVGSTRLPPYPQSQQCSTQMLGPTQLHQSVLLQQRQKQSIKQQVLSMTQPRHGGKTLRNAMAIYSHQGMRR